MTDPNPQADHPPRVLATDLDGTLIPLPGEADNIHALDLLRDQRDQGGFGLIFATGRHRESVMEAMLDHRLPEPDWIVCDVGTSIHRKTSRGWEPFAAYEEHLAGITGVADRTVVERQLADLDGLTLQVPEHQKRFKVSYDAAPGSVEPLVHEINTRLSVAKCPWRCMGSVDPDGVVGLIDILPNDVSKAYALIWLSAHTDDHPDDVVYAGDSGNDLAALTSGFRAIVVGNASAGLADEVAASLTERGLERRLFAATRPATSGVVEGCRHFGLIS